MKKILVLGANPSCQKTLFFNGFRYGEVNRAVKMECFPSGKGINFCRAAGIWGRMETLLFQFCGGSNGKRIENALKAENISALSLPVAGETRCCTTCLDEKNHVMTELIEPSSAVSETEADALLAAFRTGLPDACGAAICGTLPDGSNSRIYHEVAKMAHDAGVPLFLDAWKNIRECLEHGTNYLKINREELAAFTGEKTLRAGLKKLFASCRVEFAAITDGAEQAFASDGRTLFTYAVPVVEQVVNPIGCGDTASAVFAGEISAGTPCEKAFQLALCAASANCLNSLPGSFDRNIAMDFAAQNRFASEKL